MEYEKTVSIRRAGPGDAGRIMEIYRTAQDAMIRNGNPTQWGHFYPTRELVDSDIASGISYVLETDRVHAVFVLISGEEPTYGYIENGAWRNDGPYLTVHRVASDGTLRGVVSDVLDFCKTLSGNIRIDTHHNNHIMQHQIEKNGFVSCGTIYVEDGSPRIAYQWINE